MPGMVARAAVAWLWMGAHCVSGEPTSSVTEPVWLFDGIETDPQRPQPTLPDADAYASDYFDRMGSDEPAMTGSGGKGAAKGAIKARPPTGLSTHTLTHAVCKPGLIRAQRCQNVKRSYAIYNPPYYGRTGGTIAPQAYVVCIHDQGQDATWACVNICQPHAASLGFVAICPMVHLYTTPPLFPICRTPFPPYVRNYFSILWYISTPPFSPYVAPRFPHMSEIDSLFSLF